MNNKKIINDISIIFNFFYSTLTNINLYNINKNDEFINFTFVFIFNIIILLKKLINTIENSINKIDIYKDKYKNKIIDILDEINDLDNNTLKLYNNYINKNSIKSTKNDLYNNKLLLYNEHTISNLDTESIDNLLNNNNINNKQNLIILDNENYIDYDYIDIGFNNLYKLHIFKKINKNIPFNLLVYIIELNQVVIKVGDEKNYKFINSKIYKTYDVKLNSDNSRSILCNNNIKDLNKKCNNYNCNYYHDYILGYKDNCHFDRQFSNNPIVFNCPNFKDGSKISENKNKVDWITAINLYQFNLSCLLLGCIHSLTNK